MVGFDFSCFVYWVGVGLLGKRDFGTMLAARFVRSIWSPTRWTIEATEPTVGSLTSFWNPEFHGAK